jgi:hypothetical protein
MCTVNFMKSTIFVLVILNKNSISLFYSLATLMNCLMIFDLLTRLCSEQTSVTTQNISRFTNCKSLNVIKNNKVTHTKKSIHIFCILCNQITITSTYLLMWCIFRVLMDYYTLDFIITHYRNFWCQIRIMIQFSLSHIMWSWCSKLTIV